MLWEKVSNRTNGLFVNIFDQVEDIQAFHTSLKSQIEVLKNKDIWQKNNERSLLCRATGNMCFGRGDYRKAIDFYNMSLCYAENGSEHLSLAYGNRSNCFFKLKMYDKCLIDIELAIEAHYPQQKMAKLNKRREDCEQSIADGQLVEAYKPKFDFEQFSNSVELRHDPRSGNTVIAKEDLKVGETICTELTYVGEENTDNYSACNICLNLNENLVPCKVCTVALFCYKKCENNNFHHVECKMKPVYLVTDQMLYHLRIPLTRSILLANQAFPSIDSLMETVANVISNRVAAVPSFDTPQSKYISFLLMEDNEIHQQFIYLAYSLYNEFMDQTYFQQQFTNKKYKRFFMHLIWQHLIIIGRNAIILNTSKLVLDDSEEEQSLVKTIRLGILQSFFKHSRTPNIVILPDNDSITGIVLKPIEKGENLTIARLTSFDCVGFPWTLSNLRCDCSSCAVPLHSLFQRMQIQSRLDREIEWELTTALETPLSSQSDIEKLKSNCIRLLTNFNWNEKTSIVVSNFVKALILRRDALCVYADTNFIL